MPVRIALIGDESTHPSHVELNAVRRQLGAGVVAEWVPTDSPGARDLAAYDGIWLVPGSPYRDDQAAYDAVRFARENDVPFLGDRAALHHVAFARPARHLDLLHHARRRWKGVYPDCRLKTLEWYVCRRRRSGDVPSEEVPGLYHDFVKHGGAHRLVPVFHHNLLDVITMDEMRSSGRAGAWLSSANTRMLAIPDCRRSTTRPVTTLCAAGAPRRHSTCMSRSTTSAKWLGGASAGGSSSRWPVAWAFAIGTTATWYATSESGSAALKLVSPAGRPATLVTERVYAGCPGMSDGRENVTRAAMEQFT